MRKNTKLIVPMALAVAITLSITGQEEPLPVVRAKTSQLDVTVREPAVYLTVELNHPFDPALLAEAARANDFAAFDALYNGARKIGQPVAAYSTLHELWAWSMSDPIGGFYGKDTYARFARAYSDYARYIEDYRIVDSNGNVFYPSSETRAFLLARAIEGRSAPTSIIAKREEAVSEARQPAKQQPRTHHSAARSHRTTAKPRVASKPVAATPPVVATPVIATPVRTTAPAATAPANAAPAASTPVTTTPAATTPVVTEPPVIVKAEPAAEPVAVPAQSQPSPQPVAANNPFANRGMLLLVIGLIGFGILALILRTPKDVPTSILPTTQAGKPPAPVEPFRKTPSAPGSPKSEEPTKPRATGSHG